ncbi:MAG: hypothetical protein MJ010_07385 [Paludibacteraceae bacterium]|nr:hypothetical protein [Paludibacteraceae bacterium]
MKKIIYTMGVALVMLASVSCKKNAEVNEPAPQPTGIMRHVTVSAAGHGTTKTSVISGGALVWSNDDHLNIVPTLGDFDAVALDITEGVGSASGTFEGDIDSGIKDDTQLYGWAGGAWSYSSGTFSIDMPVTQTYAGDELAENAYPSIGKGTIGGGISLGNPFGVLCLIVKGKDTDKVKSITLTSATKKLAGVFTVDPSKTPALVTSGESCKNMLVLLCSEFVLSSDGVNFRIVVPAASYANKDLTVTVTKSDGTSFDVKLSDTTITANNVTKVNVVEPVRPECQKTLDEASNWVKIGEQYWLKENTRCIEYDTESEACNAIWLINNTIPTSETAEYTPYYIDPTTKVNKPDCMTEDQYGKLGVLYNWAAAVGIENGGTRRDAFTDKRQGICPNGSHIPTVEEWQTLYDYIYNDKSLSSNTVGEYLKTTSGWYDEGKPQTYPQGLDTYGFAALPAGGALGKDVNLVGKEAFFLTAVPKEDDINCAYFSNLYYKQNYFLYNRDGGKGYAQSVRCLKD